MNIPKNFDWVTERSKCSLLAVFTHLSAVVDSDVKAIEGLRRPKESYTVTRPLERKIVVVKTSDMGGYMHAESIIFELSENEISVNQYNSQGKGKELFTAKPSLLQSGECRLEVAGEKEPFELWQVSRKGLEDLFFSRG